MTAVQNGKSQVTIATDWSQAATAAPAAVRRLPLAPLYWGATIGLFSLLLFVVAFYTPIEREMGIVQKIFYLHLPVAINAFLAAFIVFIGSIGYLWYRSMWWDDLAAAAGKVTVLFCGIVLLTGMFWGRSAWGVWWTWSPRLTFSLVLFLLYVVYVLLRPAIHSPQRRAIISAVYGIVAFLDVPLVYLSTKLMPDIHPSSVTLEPAMRLTLLLGFLPVTLLMFGLLTARFGINRRLRVIEDDRLSRLDGSNPAPPLTPTRSLGGMA
jgi:heme exporter protein C